MRYNVQVDHCPGFCISGMYRCAVEEVMECPRKKRLTDGIEVRRARDDDVWFVEILA